MKKTELKQIIKEVIAETMNDIKWHSIDDEDAYDLMADAKLRRKEILAVTDIAMRIIGAGSVDLYTFHSKEVSENILKFAVIN